MDTALPQKSLSDLILGFLFPELCLHCGGQIANRALICPVCAANGLLEAAESVTAEDGISRRFSFSYAGAGKTLFKAAKFSERRRATRFFANAARADLQSLAAGDALLVALPSRKKFLRRLLSACVPEEKLVFSAFSMKRRFFSRDANKLLGEAGRYRRIQESLLFRAGLPAAERYVLCDDVSTTGATLAQAAFLLQGSGIPKEKILIWALMHRPRYLRTPRQ